MSFLLDTNICSAHMRRPGGLAHRFIQHSGRIWISSTVLAELFAGAYKLDRPEKTLAAIHELRKDVGLLLFDEQCAEMFGKLRGTLRRGGIEVSPMDLMIAAAAGPRSDSGNARHRRLSGHSRVEIGRLADLTCRVLFSRPQIGAEIHLCSNSLPLSSPLAISRKRSHNSSRVYAQARSIRSSWA